MIRPLLWALVIATIAKTHAEILYTEVSGLDAAKTASELTMVMEQSGRVLWADPRDDLLIKGLQKAVVNQESLRLDVRDDDGMILGISSVKGKKPKDNKPAWPSDEDEVAIADAGYLPTTFSSRADAQSAFNSMDGRTKSDSQCYNRAHMWTYDLQRTRGIQSMKLFLFFTRRYIRGYNYKWWFHVTPLTYVSGYGEQTMDRSFTRGPLNVRTWTNIFMRNDAQCRSVSSYSQYANHQEEEWCYLIRMPMYYRQPIDVQQYESRGRVLTGWSSYELRQARRQAFIYWWNYNP